MIFTKLLNASLLKNWESLTLLVHYVVKLKKLESNYFLNALLQELYGLEVVGDSEQKAYNSPVMKTS
jgi:hypothetical protein